MTTGGKTEQIRPAGADQYDAFLGTIGKNWKTLNGQWNDINGQITNMLPKTSVLSPEFQTQLKTNMDDLFKQNLGYLQQGFGKQFRANNFNNIARFGGLNNSVARDTNGEIDSQYGKSLNEMVTNLNNYKYNIQNNQLQQQQQGLNNYTNFKDYIDGYGNNYLNLIGQAQNYAPIDVKTPGTNWGSLIGTALAVGAAPFTGGASLAYIPTAASVGNTVGSYL